MKTDTELSIDDLQIVHRVLREKWGDREALDDKSPVAWHYLMERIEKVVAAIQRRELLTPKPLRGERDDG